MAKREDSPHTPMFLQKSSEVIEGKEAEVKKEVYGKWKSAERAENKKVAGGCLQRSGSKGIIAGSGGQASGPPRRAGERGVRTKSCAAYHVGYYHRGIESRSYFRGRVVEKQRKSNQSGEKGGPCPRVDRAEQPAATLIAPTCPAAEVPVV